MIKCEEIELDALLDIENNQGNDIDMHNPEIARHFESCSRCQRRLSELAADAEQWEEVPQLLQVAGATENADYAFASERWKRQTSWTDAMAKSLLSAANHPEMLGRIGRYDVERLIGSGGMGVVFKAYDTELNRPVAIKLLAPYLASNGAARCRFAREARAAAAVVDDHVVPIHNVETGRESAGEHPFLVMKYIAGGSLQQRLDREGPLDVCEILRIGMHTAKGLAAAHAHGLIHRDVKPSNILLDEGVDRALLTDFGLARASDDASLTRSGFHPGTPHYMSPEQVRGEAIDSRSDLFGLGCVLYAMSTGHPPFRSDSSYAVLRRITDDTPRPIRETNPGISIWLERIVMRLLAKSPSVRYDTAEQVTELLEQCLAHIQQPTTNSLPESLQDEASTKRHRFPPYLKWIAASMFAFALFFAGLLIVLEWNKGTLTIESDVDDVPIRIMQGENVVERLTVTKSTKMVRIAAGNYVIDVDGDFPNVAIKNGTVSLARRGVSRVDVQQMESTHEGAMNQQVNGYWGFSTTNVGPLTLPAGVRLEAIYVRDKAMVIERADTHAELYHVDIIPTKRNTDWLTDFVVESTDKRERWTAIGTIDTAQSGQIIIHLTDFSDPKCEPCLWVLNREGQRPQQTDSKERVVFLLDNIKPSDDAHAIRAGDRVDVYVLFLSRDTGPVMVDRLLIEYVEVFAGPLPVSRLPEAATTGRFALSVTTEQAEKLRYAKVRGGLWVRPREANASLLFPDGINRETLTEMQRSFEPVHSVPQESNTGSTKTELEGDWTLEAYINSDGTALKLEWVEDATMLNIRGDKIGFGGPDASTPIEIDTKSKTVTFKMGSQKDLSTHHYELKGKKLMLRSENQSVLHYGRASSRGLTGNGNYGASQSKELEGDWHLKAVQYPDKLTTPDYVQNLTIRGEKYTSSFPAMNNSSTCPFELDTVAKRIKLLSETGCSIQQYELIGDRLAIGGDQDHFKLIFARGHAPLGNDAAKSSQKIELDGDWTLEAYLSSDGTALKLAWAEAPYLRIRGNEIDYDRGRNPSRIEFDAQNKTLTYQKDSEQAPSTYRFELKGKQLTLRNENNSVLHYSRNSTAHVEDKTPTELEGPWYLESVAGKPNAYVAETRMFRGNRCELRSADGHQIRQGEVDPFEKWISVRSKNAGGGIFATNETYELVGQELTIVDTHSNCIYRYRKGLRPAPNAPTEIEGEWYLESLQVIDGTKVEFKAENRVVRGNRLSCFFADRDSNHRIEVDPIEKRMKIFEEDESAFIPERYELNGDKLTIYNHGGLYVSVYAKGHAPLSKGLDALPQELSALWRSAIVDLVYHSDGTSLLGNGVVVSADGMLITHLNTDWDGAPNSEPTNIKAHFDDGSEVSFKFIAKDATGLTTLKPLMPMQVNHFFKIAASKYRVGDSAWMCFRPDERETSIFFDRAKVVLTDRKIADRPSPVWQLECQQEKRDRSGGMPLLTHDGELLAITLPHKRDIITAIPADQFKALLEKSERVSQSSSPNENNSSQNIRKWAGIVTLYAGGVNEQYRIGHGMIISSNSDIIAYLPNETELASKSIVTEIDGERIELELGEPSTRTTGNGMYCFRPKQLRAATKYLKLQLESEFDSRDPLFIGEAFTTATLKVGGNRFDNYIPSDLGIVNEHFTHMWRVGAQPITIDETATTHQNERFPNGTPIYNATGRLLAITVSEENEILAVPAAELKIIFPQTLKE